MEPIKQADAERAQEIREAELREKYKNWKPTPPVDREKFQRLLKVCCE